MRDGVCIQNRCWSKPDKGPLGQGFYIGPLCLHTRDWMLPAPCTMRWAEALRREKETLRLRKTLMDLPSLAREVGREEGLRGAELRSGSRKKRISKARRRFCQLAAVKQGYPGAQLARFLGVTTSAVVRAANPEELPKIGTHL